MEENGEANGAPAAKGVPTAFNAFTHTLSLTLTLCSSSSSSSSLSFLPCEFSSDTGVCVCVHTVDPLWTLGGCCRDQLTISDDEPNS